MNNHQKFIAFYKSKLLSDKDKAMLIEKRNILREKIRVYFKNELRKNTPKFYMQGSLVMGTTIRPLSGEFDIDDGIYLSDGNLMSYQTEAVHSWVYKAVEEHTDKVEDKARCVRVTYKGNYHVDFPIYCVNNNQLYIAEKGNKQWHPSDPKAVVDWFKNHPQREKLRKMVIYLKAWKDYRQLNNSSISIIDGFQLTVLAYEYLAPSNDDEEMFYRTVEKIHASSPTSMILKDKNILEKYSAGFLNNFYNEFKKLYEKSHAAYFADSPQPNLWQEVFGDKFPIH